MIIQTSDSATEQQARELAYRDGRSVDEERAADWLSDQETTCVEVNESGVVFLTGFREREDSWSVKDMEVIMQRIQSNKF